MTAFVAYLNGELVKYNVLCAPILARQNMRIDCQGTVHMIALRDVDYVLIDGKTIYERSRAVAKTKRKTPS